MNDKRAVCYFKQSDFFRILGAALLVAGVALLFLSGYLGIGIVLRVVMLIAMPVGLVLFVAASSLRASDSEMDERIRRGTEGLALSPEEEDRYRKRLDLRVPNESVEGYVYREGLMLAKDKGSTVRSEEYTKTLFVMLIDGLAAVSRTVSLVSEAAEEHHFVFYFSEIEKIELRDGQRTLTFGKKQFTVKDTRLEITYDGGKLFSVPARRNLKTEQAIERIYKLMGEYENP